MIVVREHQDQRVVAARPRPFARKADRIVEHDGVVDRALHVQQMRVFVDHPGFDHQEEAGIVLRQNVQRGLHLFGQIGLVGKLLDAAALEEFAVQRAIHISRANRPSNWRVSDLAFNASSSVFVVATE